MAAGGTSARSARALARPLGMVSPDLSPFLSGSWGPFQGRQFIPSPAVAVGALPEGELGGTPGEGLGRRPSPSQLWLHLSPDAGLWKTLF